MLTFLHCTTEDEALAELIRKLDADLRRREGDLQNVYSAYNKLDGMLTALVAREDGVPAGCGCLKQYDGDTVEVKRIFVDPAYRNRGIAGKILKDLEGWAEERGFDRAVLETGLRQPEAIHLYEKSGYRRIENYGPYKSMPNSVCFEKTLCTEAAESEIKGETE